MITIKINATAIYALCVIFVAAEALITAIMGNVMMSVLGIIGLVTILAEVLQELREAKDAIDEATEKELEIK